MANQIYKVISRLCDEQFVTINALEMEKYLNKILMQR